MKYTLTKKHNTLQFKPFRVSMDEHKTCLKKYYLKVVQYVKVVAEKNVANNNGADILDAQKAKECVFIQWGRCY